MGSDGRLKLATVRRQHAEEIVVVVVEDGVGGRAAADHGNLMLLRDRRCARRRRVVRRAEQERMVLRYQLLGDGRGNRRPALVVDHVDVDRMANALDLDPTAGIDPVLAEEVALLGHLAAACLATGEREYRADVDRLPSWQATRRVRAAGRQDCTQRDEPEQNQPRPRHGG